MFTGIIEQIGKIKSIQTEGTNKHFEIEAEMAKDLRVDQSVAHNGVCLTVTHVDGKSYKVSAIQETLEKTSFQELKPGDEVNLERCMLNNGRFDGHVVQGHVDQIGEVSAIQVEEGSWLYDVTYDPSLGNVTVEKGSITINGISLTCFNSQKGKFRVAIIPYTYEHTTMKHLKVGDKVNLEFDIIGKYVKRLLEGY